MHQHARASLDWELHRRASQLDRFYDQTQQPQCGQKQAGVSAASDRKPCAGNKKKDEAFKTVLQLLWQKVVKS